MGENTQQYRVNFKLRRQGQPALDFNKAELKSEAFDSDEDFCLAIASELLELLQTDREYLNSLEG